MVGKDRLAAAMAAALALAGCGKGQEAGTAEGSAQSDTVSSAAGSSPAAEASGPAAPAAFAQCKSCHAVEPGKHGIGPSLAGVYGTKAGDIAGYSFSPALKASGLIWDDATLDQWLAGPMKLVPGTKMTFAGLSDPAQRKAVIDYMKTLK